MLMTNRSEPASSKPVNFQGPLRPTKRLGNEDARKSIRARGNHKAPFTEAGRMQPEPCHHAQDPFAQGLTMDAASRASSSLHQCLFMVSEGLILTGLK